MTRSKITVQTVVDSDLHTIWNCWTQPEHIIRWNFASDGWHCPSAQNDLTVGGKYLARMEAKDKSHGFDFEAIYTDIDTEERLVYVIEDGRRVETTFRDECEGVVVTTIFEAEDSLPEEMQRYGWQAILENFKKYVVSR